MKKVGYKVRQSLSRTGTSITKWGNYYIVGHCKYARNYEKSHTITPFYRYAKLNKLHLLLFVSDIARFNSYDEFLAGLANYEIKTTSKFVVMKRFKEFKEYGKITFPNMSVG